MPKQLSEGGFGELARTPSFQDPRDYVEMSVNDKKFNRSLIVLYDRPRETWNLWLWACSRGLGTAGQRRRWSPVRRRRHDDGRIRAHSVQLPMSLSRFGATFAEQAGKHQIDSGDVVSGAAASVVVWIRAPNHTSAAARR